MTSFQLVFLTFSLPIPRDRDYSQEKSTISFLLAVHVCATMRLSLLVSTA